MCVFVLAELKHALAHTLTHTFFFIQQFISVSMFLFISSFAKCGVWFYEGPICGLLHQVIHIWSSRFLKVSRTNFIASYYHRYASCCVTSWNFFHHYITYFVFSEERGSLVMVWWAWQQSQMLWTPIFYKFLFLPATVSFWVEHTQLMRSQYTFTFLHQIWIQC
jgi:hypothetical protein